MFQDIGLLLKFLQFALLEAGVIKTFQLELQILTVGVIGLEFGLETGQFGLQGGPVLKTLLVLGLDIAVLGYGIHNIQLEGLCAQRQVLVL